ncbi:MAG: GAF domain-containing protein [Acidimicrobiia bacterium]
MAGDRLLRILSLLDVGTSEGTVAARLCEVCAEVMAISGAGVMLMSGGVQRGSICSSDAVSSALEELHHTLGEGPCHDAHDQGRPVLEPDLSDPARPRWFAFSPAAVTAGAGAVFAFPLQVGTVRLGALQVYRDRPGPLDDDQHADSLVMAGVAARAVLVMQANAPPGLLAAELEVGADFHFVVHQASGVVAVQLEVTIGEAMIRLRAYAFANSRLLKDVAADVVAHRTRFTT